MLSLTPPCQGMSANGINTILKAISQGKRPDRDARNYLIEPCFDIIRSTRPDYIFFENVPQSATTVLLIDGRPTNFIDYLSSRLEEIGYDGMTKLVNFADYGVPQSRRRLVGLFVNKNKDEDPDRILPLPDKTIVTVRQAIGHTPKIDASSKAKAAADSFHLAHRVRVMRPELYRWVKNTEEGRSAFENDKCDECGANNDRRMAVCVDCQRPLPKPHVGTGDKTQLIKGYETAYKRMRWDKPACTITTRSAFASSQANLHPDQNRVLSAYECAVLQGIDPEDIEWLNPVTNKIYPDYLLREVIGEAVPPIYTEKLGINLSVTPRPRQLELSYA